MNKTFLYTTPQQQIEKLKCQGLSFGNENEALEILQIYGYYNVINTYKDFYILKNKNGSKFYKPGTSFEQIFSLFTLDHYIRSSMMMAMLDVEEFLRASLADVIASSFGTDHHIYLNKQNYRNRKTKDPRFSLNSILQSMNNSIQHADKDPLVYYRDTYNVVPPWVLFKNVYLSLLVNFVRQLKPNELSLLIQKMYGFDDSLSKRPVVTHLFFDTLHICREYRNISAHGGRVYNAQLKSKCRIPNTSEINLLSQTRPQINQLPSSQSIGQLCLLLSLFAYRQPSDIVEKSVNTQVIRHCRRFPQDAKYLSQSLGGIIYMST